MINGMLQQSLKNPDISMSNLVLMNKAGLDINPESTKLFEMYSNGRTELAVATEQNFNDMLSMIEGLLSDGNIEGSAKLASDMIDIFNIGKEPDELVLTLVAGNETDVPVITPNNLSEMLDSLVDNDVPLSDNALTQTETDINVTNLNKNTQISSILTEEQRLETFTLF